MRLPITLGGPRMFQHIVVTCCGVVTAYIVVTISGMIFAKNVWFCNKCNKQSFNNFAVLGDAGFSLQHRTPDVFSEQAAQVIRSTRMSEEQLQALPILLGQLQIIMSARWPGSTVSLYGSIPMGLATRGSDADCCVLLPDRRRHDHSAALTDEAQRILRQYPGLFAHISPIPRAPLPVFTFHHLPTGYQTDLTFNNYNALRTVEFMHYVFRLDPRIYPLTFIVKHWGKVHGLTGSTTLPSYGLVSLVLFYLQQTAMMPSIESLQKNADSYFIDRWNYGYIKLNYSTQNDIPLRLLVGGFFSYYNNFDFNKYVISPYVGYPVDKTLFEDVNRVPKAFNLYVKNVRTNITQPLSFENVVVVQDMFQHNRNLANVDYKPNCTFITQIKYAAFNFQENNQNYLMKIL